MNKAHVIAAYQHEYIDKPEALLALCEQLHGSEWIALDTEFMREKNYFPRLCLLQVANEKRVACIDSLMLADLSPLFEVLYNKSIVKVLHSAQQDLEIFYYLRKSVPAPVFDTQIAATLLGYGEQISYAGLVQDILGITLGKIQTRTDWSQRPLTLEQRQYAADDVYYLGQIYIRLRSDLARRGRLEWLDEDFAAFSDVERYYTNPDNAWLRIKGYGRLRGVKLAVLRALAAWREREAVSEDKPRRWIIGDDGLLDLAQRMPNSLAQLGRLPGLHGGKIKRYGDKILAVIATSRALPRNDWPHPPEQAVIKSEQEPLLDALQAIIRMAAARHEVSPGNLAGRKELEKLLSGNSDIPLMHGWRAALAGNEIKAYLAGQTQLAVRNGMLQMIPSRDLNVARK